MREYRVWRPEEEAALRQGVLKHGTGAWEVIRTDPEFTSLLKDRTGVQLKDKWRNLVKFRHLTADELQVLNAHAQKKGPRKKPTGPPAAKPVNPSPAALANATAAATARDSPTTVSGSGGAPHAGNAFGRASPSHIKVVRGTTPSVSSLAPGCGAANAHSNHIDTAGPHAPGTLANVKLEDGHPHPPTQQPQRPHVLTQQQAQQAQRLQQQHQAAQDGAAAQQHRGLPGAAANVATAPAQPRPNSAQLVVTHAARNRDTSSATLMQVIRDFHGRKQHEAQAMFERLQHCTVALQRAIGLVNEGSIASRAYHSRLEGLELAHSQHNQVQTQWEKLKADVVAAGIVMEAAQEMFGNAEPIVLNTEHRAICPDALLELIDAHSPDPGLAELDPLSLDHGANGGRGRRVGGDDARFHYSDPWSFYPSARAGTGADVAVAPPLAGVDVPKNRRTKRSRAEAAGSDVDTLLMPSAPDGGCALVAIAAAAAAANGDAGRSGAASSWADSADWLLRSGDDVRGDSKAPEVTGRRLTGNEEQMVLDQGFDDDFLSSIHRYERDWDGMEDWELTDMAVQALREMSNGPAAVFDDNDHDHHFGAVRRSSANEMTVPSTAGGLADPPVGAHGHHRASPLLNAAHGAAPVLGTPLGVRRRSSSPAVMPRPGAAGGGGGGGGLPSGAALRGRTAAPLGRSALNHTYTAPLTAAHEPIAHHREYPLNHSMLAPVALGGHGYVSVHGHPPTHHHTTEAEPPLHEPLHHNHTFISNETGATTLTAGGRSSSSRALSNADDAGDGGFARIPSFGDLESASGIVSRGLSGGLMDSEGNGPSLMYMGARFPGANTLRDGDSMALI